MDKDKFNCVLRWIEENLCTGASVDSLASANGYSRRAVEQMFRKHSDFSPGEYLFRRRMTRAAVMLRVTSLQISEIASYLHYYSSQNFSRAFRLFSGTAPTIYRKNKVWNTHPLQYPLLYSYIVSNSEVFNLKYSLKITGRRRCTESKYDSMHDNAYLNFLRSQLTNYKGVGSQELLVLCRRTGGDNAYTNRKGVIKVETIIGKRTMPDEDVHGTIPSGKYIKYEFNGCWEDFSIFSRVIYLKHVSDMQLYCIEDFSYMEISSFENKLYCKLYIPVAHNEMDENELYL